MPLRGGVLSLGTVANVSLCILCRSMRDAKALRRNRMRNTTTRPLFVGIPDAVLSRIVSLVHELLVRDERNADEFADEDEYYWEYVKDEEYDGCDE